MVFNHSKLLGKIRECGYTQKGLAEAINMNVSTLNEKLKNKSRFTTKEIDRISKLLDISKSEIGVYFFNQ